MSMEASETCITAEALDCEQKQNSMIDQVQKVKDL